MELVCAASGEKGGDGFEEDFEVEPGGPVFDVIEVEHHHFVKGEFAPSADWPESRHAGRDFKTPFVPIFVFGDFVDEGRTGADEGHIAAQDVPELGEFIHAGAAEPFADGGTARVVADFEQRTLRFVQMPEGLFFFVCADAHGAEFVCGKDSAAAPDAVLFEDDCAGGRSFDEQGNDAHRNQEDDEEDYGKDNVHRAFESERAATDTGFFDADEGNAANSIHRDAG